MGFAAGQKSREGRLTSLHNSWISLILFRKGLREAGRKSKGWEINESTGFLLVVLINKCSLLAGHENPRERRLTNLVDS